MANRYWVGGGGTWDGTDTSHWSATSGGSSGASVPTSADNVFINASSGAGSIVIQSGAICADLNTAGYTGSASSFSQGYPFIYGNLTLGKSLAISPTLQLGATQTIASYTYSITDLILGSGTTAVCSDTLTITSELRLSQYSQVTFLVGSTNSVGSFSSVGSSGTEVKLRTSSAGTQATLSDTSGVNQLDYTDSKDINFTGGAAWVRGTGFIDSGNNTGLTSGLTTGLFFGDL